MSSSTPHPFHPFGGSRRLVRTIGVLLSLLLLAPAGCEDGTSPSTLGEIRGIIMIEGVGQAGVVVELTGEVGRETVSDESGRFAFDEVPAGAYVVSIRGQPSDASFPSTSRTAVIARASGQRSVTVDFVGSFIRTSTVRGQVISRQRPLGNVTVRLTGPDTALATTDSEGRYSFPGLRRGNYRLQISGFPANVSFPVAEKQVAVETGETANVDFDGQPELTASLTISSLRRELPGGGTELADPSALRGRIQVEVAVDRGEDTLESVQLLLDDHVVGQQSFGADGAPLPTSEVEVEIRHADGSSGEDGPATASLGVTFSLPTDDYDPSTGEVRFFNGDRVLRARLSTREGGDAVWTSTIPVQLVNRDTFVAQLSPERGPVAGRTGEEWIGGELAIALIPVVYSPDRAVTSAVVELRRVGGGPVRRVTVEQEEAPLHLSFPDRGEPADSNLVQYQTPLDALDELRVGAAWYTDGEAVPHLPVSLEGSVRVDNVAPMGGTFRLPDQGEGRSCCLGNWIGEAFSFSDAFEGGEDGGVGGERVSFHAGSAEFTDEELAQLPEIAQGGDLAASSLNSAYRVVGVLRDALGNRRVVPLAPSSGNPESSDLGAVFGIDLSSPQLRFAVASVGNWAVNPPNDAKWVLRIEDEASGFSAQPVRSSLRRIAPGVDGVAGCIFPGGGTCELSPDDLSRTVPGGLSGYLRYDARVLDRAGNLSPALRGWVLRDTRPPEVQAMAAPAAIVGGGTLEVEASVADDVDVHRAEVALRFEGGGVTESLAFSAPDTLGRPFGGSPVAAATARWALPGVVALEGVGMEGPNEFRPDGVLTPVRALELTAEDAAGNRSEAFRRPTSSAEGAAPLSFSPEVRGSEGGVTSWRLEVDGTEACSPLPSWMGVEGCPEGSGSPILIASASGEGGALQAPFSRVHFYAEFPDGLRWIGEAGEPELSADQPGPEGRQWRWTLAWRPEPGFPAGTHPMVVVGVDGDGVALRSSSVDGVTVAPGER
jgi:hypothetical protein